ncbi:MAG: hypothetical protein LBT82_03330 [Oscillospiraceae bacterium]|jgi:hypothetical protein|nr:hypothetical protein [Oscillospiraceae bacterium]
MKNCAQEFLEILENNDELRKKIENAKSTEEKRKLVSPYLNGCSFEEFQNQLKEIKGPLSNEDLMNVSGGGAIGKTLGKAVGNLVGGLFKSGNKLEGIGTDIGDKIGDGICSFLKF